MGVVDWLSACACSGGLSKARATKHYCAVDPGGGGGSLGADEPSFESKLLIEPCVDCALVFFYA